MKKKTQKSVENVTKHSRNFIGADVKLKTPHLTELLSKSNNAIASPVCYCLAGKDMSLTCYWEVTSDLACRATSNCSVWVLPKIKPYIAYYILCLLL